MGLKENTKTNGPSFVLSPCFGNSTPLGLLLEQEKTKLSLLYIRQDKDKTQ